MSSLNFSRPISLFCAAAPADTFFLKRWEMHLWPLKYAKDVRFWSPLSINAGANRMEQISLQLEQAQCIVLLISADFFNDKECLVILAQALQLRQHGTEIIPLLLRPFDWKTTEVGSLACLPLNSTPITEWTDSEHGWLRAVEGLKWMLHLSTHPSYPVGKPANADREKMLHRLRKIYQEGLEDSLRNTAKIELSFAEHPNAVRNHRDLLMRSHDGTEKMLSEHISILDIYDEAQGELLILGGPGTGKSTLLLDLAFQLVERAETEESRPLPVIIPLFSWAKSRLRFADWLVEQLLFIYGVPRKLGRQWVEQGQLILLLDGLDEIEVTARPRCITTINSYHRAANFSTSLVVCSRQTDYNVASASQRLFLLSAVVVQPLSQKQVAQALHQGGESLVALREEIATNRALLALATTPLMLSVLFLTYKETTINNLPQKETPLEHRIWDDYVTRMIDEKGADRRTKQDKQVKRYTRKHTYCWLGWLARQMREHSQHQFYGEKLQEDWLSATQRQLVWWLAVCLPAVLLGVFASILLSLIFSPQSIANPSWIPQNALIGSLIGWCCSENQRRKALAVANPFPWPLRERIHRVQFPRLIVAMLFSFFYAAIINFSPPGVWLAERIRIGIIMTISAWLLQALFASGLGLFEWIQETPGRRSLSAGTVFGITLALIGELSSGLNILQTLLVSELCFGGTAYLVTRILDTQKARTAPLVERVGWAWRSLLQWNHLRTSLIIILVCLITFGIGYADQIQIIVLGDTGGRQDFGLFNWFYGLTYGLSIGLSYWLVLGLFMGTTRNHLKDEDRHQFNQGIARSLRNSFLMSSLGAGIMAGMGVLIISLGYSLGFDLSFAFLLSRADNNLHFWDGSIALNFDPSIVWLTFICTWFLIWAAAGGLTILRHYIVRLLLVRNHTFPWQVRSFLEDATARILLKRVGAGGGYEFIHALLLDHFADTTLLPAEETSTS